MNSIFQNSANHIEFLDYFQYFNQVNFNSFADRDEKILNKTTKKLIGFNNHFNNLPQYKNITKGKEMLESLINDYKNLLTKSLEEELINKYSYWKVRDNNIFVSPNSLFHFTRIDSSLNIVKTDKLNLKKITELKDPYEQNLKSAFANASYWDDGKTNYMKKYEEFYLYLESASSVYKSTSFCSNELYIDGFNSTLLNVIGNEYSKNLDLPFKPDFMNKPFPCILKNKMWELYTDNHQGVCLIFDQTKLKEQNQNVDLIFGLIDYRSNIKLSLSNASVDLNKKPEEYQLLIDLIVYTKEYDYRDECEFRILSKNESINHIDISNCLTGIVLGTNCNRDLYLPILQQLLINSSNSNCKIYQKKFYKGSSIPDFLLDLSVT